MANRIVQIVPMKGPLDQFIALHEDGELSMIFVPGRDITPPYAYAAIIQPMTVRAEGA